MSDSVFDTLSGFFDDPGDWAFVIDYTSYGIANVVRDYDLSLLGFFKKRIVVRTIHNRIWSIVWNSTSTPSGCWEAVPLKENQLDGEPQYYTTPELFEALRGQP